MNLYHYQYQMARNFMQKSLGSTPHDIPEPSSSIESPVSKPKLPSHIYTWLARALGLGMLLALVGLWLYSLLQRFAG